jgi:hypothetical protein
MMHVFELESYVDRKTKVVSRRFIDLPSYNKQKDFFKFKNPQIGASHILKDEKWYAWNGKDYIESNYTFNIVKSIEELT